MASPSRRKALTVEEIARLPAGLVRHPQAYEWNAALGLLEAVNSGAPRIGEAGKAADEYVRLGQKPVLCFTGNTIAGMESAGGRPQGGPWLMQHFFGVFGVNGPLPLHMTAYAVEREKTRCQVSTADVCPGGHGNGSPGEGAGLTTVEDQVFTRFVNLFHHRLLSLLYRSWRTARPTRDSPGKAGPDFTDRLLSLEGGPAAYGGDVFSATRRGHVATLGGAVRTVDALERLLSSFTGSPVKVMPLEAVWRPKEDDQLSLLGKSSCTVGVSMQLGRRVRMVQSSVHLEVGPLPSAVYRGFLPRTPGGMMLSRLVRHLAGHALDLSVRLILAKGEAGFAKLGGASLGEDAWLGNDSSRRAMAGCMLYPD